MNDSFEDDRKPSAATAVFTESSGGVTSETDEDYASSSAAAGGGGGGGGSNKKPALKKKQADDSSKNRHLKWDEAVIEEHDQLRGTRMKIDEPNTPYTHYDSGAESDDSRRPKSPAHQKESISWDNLQNRLDTVAAVQQSFPSPKDYGTDQSNSDVDEEQRSEMRKIEFKEHRKRHYNEMELVRKFRQEHPGGLLDDANGEEREENGGADADDEDENDEE